jgi:two-component system alkaline phosphatase synthesis response regulator PhoP
VNRTYTTTLQNIGDIRNKALEHRILVIEDGNKHLTARITTCLVEQGYQVEVATDLRDAYNKIDEFEPQLIILGKVAPKDVHNICDQLRKTADALIIMIGSVGGGEAWTESVDAGADFYMVHPFSYIEFGARVKSMLRRYQVYGGSTGGEDTHNRN